ncbi:hypothetical protein H8D36_04940 [archaeon]|nr:hypothetical protein [archaeon]MBL7056742.1 hypothetical protein [Candidatus Woesearchaeota archaeon]
MTSLLACLSTGKGSWAHLLEVIRGTEWDNVILVTNEFGKERFNEPNVQLITLDLNLSPDILSDSIVAALHGKNLGMEVAINMSSGTGNEHMALLSAVLKLGLGMRLVFSKNGTVEELKLFNASFD